MATSAKVGRRLSESGRGARPSTRGAWSPQHGRSAPAAFKPWPPSHVEGYKLSLGFDDGGERVVDLSHALWGTIGGLLRGVDYFRRVRVDPELRTPDGFDLNLDVLHGAVIHGSELPRVDHGLPKTLAGEVFQQWIDPANLALLSERDRTLALVLAFCGFRVSSSSARRR